MSSIKISQLTEKATMDGSEELLINDSGTSKKMTTQPILDAQAAAETAQTAAETAQTGAETAETNAASSASAASTSASNASTSASNAASSESAAASSASAAQAAEDAALAALDNFDDRYLGVKTSDPTVDNDGDALVAGALYYNSTDDVMKVYEGSSWVAAYASLSGTLVASNNLSDLTNASAARTNLGVAIGTDVQAYSSVLQNTTASFTTADETKLDGIETGADVTDTANVTSAGALMDSEVTNLAQVKAFDSSDYATAAQGTTADSALQNVSEDTTPQLGGDLDLNSSDITGTGNIDVTGTVTADGLTVDGQGIFQTATGSNLLTLKNTDTSITGGESIQFDWVYGDTANSTSWRQISRYAGNQYQWLSNIDDAGLTLRMNLYEGGDFALYEDTGTTAKLFWDASAERLGIGTTSPDAALDILGSSSDQLRLRTAETEEYKIGRNSSNGFLDFYGTQSGYTGYTFGGVNGERMRIDSSGRVLIGINSSVGGGAALQVKGDVGNQYSIALIDGDDTVAGRMHLASTSTNSISIDADPDNLAASSYIAFRVDNSEHMRIDSSGDLLVGCTAYTGNTTNSGGGIRAAGNMFASVSNGASVFNRLSSDGDIALFRKDGTTVGSIGTASSKLTLTDTRLVDNDKLSFGNSDDLQIYHDGSNSYIVDNGTGQLILRGNAQVQIQGTNGELMGLFDMNGPVQLYHNNLQKFATTSGGVDVTGSLFASSGSIGLDSTDYINFTNNTRIDFVINSSNEFRMESDGDFHADGDVIAYSTTISDERLKENIQPIDDALAKVKQLKGCTFTYTADGKESAGLIAQDVEKVLPSAVTEKELPLKQDDGKEYKVLQYDQTIGLLVEAIKELSAKVEELENK